MKSIISISVIISTYNSEKWLEKVIWGYDSQSYKDFDIIIADDGSDSSTKDKIKELKKTTSLKLNHIWHQKNGFQKNIILNKAIVENDSDYLIFTDGDCIPRNDFVEQHVKSMEKNCFLSGGTYRLSRSISEKITRYDIIKQLCFQKSWLIENGMDSTLKLMKFSTNKKLSKFMNKITPTSISWNGGNASAWKKDLLQINGYDERLKYGGEDRELGERLINSGIVGKQIRYSAITIHLDHDRSYANKYKQVRNQKVRKNTIRNKRTWTKYGINKSLENN